jgi:DNA-binding NtrC family response regulator
MAKQLLLVDDDGDIGELIQESLELFGWDVCWKTNAEEALAVLEEQYFEAVVTDINLGGMSGIEFCERAIASRPEVPVIVLTAFGSMAAVISALRARAYDFLNKPVELSVLAHSLERAVQHRALRAEVKRLSEEVQRSRAPGKMVGQSAPMLKVYDLIHRVAGTDASVLLTGESGTGKELVAQALHAESSRAGRPFVAINCAAMPTNLLESELFGHVRGAFTDARQSRKGLFVEANGGTLLLDEVGEMPHEMQAKLLRVLQERKVRPVGGTAEISFDTRIIAATNRDLEAEVEVGRFREDLYYRLNVVQIHVPPLRARSGDVLHLAQHFLSRAAERLSKNVSGLSSDVARKLLAYDWPGNVRQLENWMERAVALTRFEQICLDDLPDKLMRHVSKSAVVVELDAEHVLRLDEVEQRYIERVLSLTGGNKLQAAKLLGLD